MRGLDATGIGNAFLDAPLTEGGWERALRLLARATGSARTQLIGVGDPDRLLFNLVTDQIPGAGEDLFAIGGLRRDVNWRAAIDGPSMRIYHDVDYAEARARRPNADMADYLERYEAPFGAHITLIREPDAVFTLALLRSRADGATTPEAVASFAAIAPYAHAAARMEMRLERQGGLLLAGTLEGMRAAALVCDRRGQVLGATPAGEALLSDRGGLRLRDGRPVAAHGPTDRSFQKLLAAVLSGTMRHARLRLPLPPTGEADGEDGQACTLLALPRREWAFGFEPAALVIVKRRTDHGDDAIETVRAALGLSIAEAEVAILSSRGLSRDAIARDRNTSPETVKAQLRTIFRKSDVTRQAELAALIAQLLD